jgi:hypothetical protein
VSSPRADSDNQSAKSLRQAVKLINDSAAELLANKSNYEATNTRLAYEVGAVERRLNHDAGYLDWLADHCEAWASNPQDDEKRSAKITGEESETDAIVGQRVEQKLRASVSSLVELIVNLKESESDFIATNLPLNDAVKQIVTCLENDAALLEELIDICEQTTPVNGLKGVPE